jgi:hypothetical protein
MIVTDELGGIGKEIQRTYSLLALIIKQKKKLRMQLDAAYLSSWFQVNLITKQPPQTGYET